MRLHVQAQFLDTGANNVNGIDYTRAIFVLQVCPCPCFLSRRHECPVHVHAYVCASLFGARRLSFAQSNLCKNEINEAVVEHFKQGKERKHIE